MSAKLIADLEDWDRMSKTDFVCMWSTCGKTNCNVPVASSFDKYTSKFCIDGACCSMEHLAFVIEPPIGSRTLSRVNHLCQEIVFCQSIPTIKQILEETTPEERIQYERAARRERTVFIHHSEPLRERNVQLISNDELMSRPQTRSMSSVSRWTSSSSPPVIINEMLRSFDTIREKHPAKMKESRSVTEDPLYRWEWDDMIVAEPEKTVSNEESFEMSPAASEIDP